MKKHQLLIVILFLAILQSCSKDTIEPTDVDNPKELKSSNHSSIKETVGDLETSDSSRLKIITNIELESLQASRVDGSSLNSFSSIPVTIPGAQFNLIVTYTGTGWYQSEVMSNPSEWIGDVLVTRSFFGVSRYVSGGFAHWKGYVNYVITYRNPTSVITQQEYFSKSVPLPPLP